MNISATELKSNIGKYLDIAQHEDVFITKNNRPLVKLTNIKNDKLAILDSLVGIAPDDGKTLEEYRDERLSVLCE